MSRIVPSAILTALAQPEVYPFYAIDLMFDTAPLYLWTGIGDKLIGVKTYIGVGTLINISGLEEASDISAKSVTISLSAINGAIISLALAEPYQRRVCRIYFGVQGVDPVVEVFSGIMNTMFIKDSSENSTIELLVDSKLVELERAKARRYTHESQQARYPTDTFLSYVTALQDREVVWGRAEK